LPDAAVSVVVPVFNAAPTLGELNQRVHAALRSRSAPWELILVNDGSRDGRARRTIVRSVVPSWRANEPELYGIP